MSDPNDSAPKPAARAAAEPPEEPPIAAGERCIGFRRRLLRTVKIADNDGIELLVQRLDPRNGVLQELRRRNLTSLQCFGEFCGRAKVPLRSRHCILVLRSHLLVDCHRRWMFSILRGPMTV